MKAIQSASAPVPPQDLGIGGQLRRLARRPRERDVVDDPRPVERGEERARAVVAVVVGDEEAVDAEHAVIGDPLEDIGPLVLEDGADAQTQAFGSRRALFQTASPGGVARIHTEAAGGRNRIVPGMLAIGAPSGHCARQRYHPIDCTWISVRRPRKSAASGRGRSAGGLTARPLSAIRCGAEHSGDGGDGKMAGSAHVAILMGTCNGARYLRAQLDTIAAQSHRDWRLWSATTARPTRRAAILAAFAAEQGGPGGGPPGPLPRLRGEFPRARRRPGDPRRLLRLRRPGRPLAP